MPSFKCKRDSKDKLGRRIHEYVSRKDGEGREFRVCDKCSHMQIIRIQREIGDNMKDLGKAINNFK